MTWDTRDRERRKSTRPSCGNKESGWGRDEPCTVHGSGSTQLETGLRVKCSKVLMRCSKVLMRWVNLLFCDQCTVLQKQNTSY